MNNSRVSSCYIVRVIEKITDEGTFLKEKKVVNREEEALKIYNGFLKSYPDCQIECLDYKGGEMVIQNY